MCCRAIFLLYYLLLKHLMWDNSKVIVVPNLQMDCDLIPPTDICRRKEGVSEGNHT